MLNLGLTREHVNNIRIEHIKKQCVFFAKRAKIVVYVFKLFLFYVFKMATSVNKAKLAFNLLMSTGKPRFHPHIYFGLPIKVSKT